jgi:HlyD family secretion protein
VKKKLLFAVAAALLVALLAYAVRPKPLPVQVAAVSRGSFRQTVEDDAKARVRERYTVSAPAAGSLARVDLHAGDAVETGTVLARLFPLVSPLLDPRLRKVAVERLASAREAHEQAVAAESRAGTAAALARTNLERTRSLVSKQAVAPLQLEQADAESRMRQSELDSMHFAERVAAHAVEEARAELESFGGKAGAGEQIKLTSPVRGRVLHVFRESAGVVSAGEPLIEVGDPALLEVVVQVLSQDAVALRAGMPATLGHWGGEGEIRGHVRRVEPAAFTHISALGVEEQRVNVVLDLDEPAAGGALLSDGFALEARILTWSGNDVVQIPTSALFRQGDGWAVFLVQGGKATVRKVTVGHRGPLSTEVLEGASVGDLVIAHPAPTLSPGTRVTPFEG